MTCLRYAQNRYEADDIMQEGLIQIYQDLSQFDEKRSQFLTWSSRVIAHTALRFLKRNKWHDTFQSTDEIDDVEEDKANMIYEQIAAKEMTMMLQQLPVGYRLVFNMYVLEGYKHQEIAEKLNISAGTSKSQLYKAKKMLQTLLEHQFTEYERK